MFSSVGVCRCIVYLAAKRSFAIENTPCSNHKIYHQQTQAICCQQTFKKKKKTSQYNSNQTVENVKKAWQFGVLQLNATCFNLLYVFLSIVE